MISNQKQEKSILWVVLVSMCVIAVFGWGFLAGSYDGAHAVPHSEQDVKNPSPDSSRVVSSRYAFFSNAVEYLPQFPTVISWNFSHRAWLPILIVALEILTLFGGIFLKRLERQLTQPSRKIRF
ncbi:MAG: hypothetical protein Tsb009_05930 [Planctomycetaceae bacterium]